VKKILLLGIPAVLLLLGLVYWREAVDLYRLQAFITESAASEAASKGPWPNNIYECEGCHGVNGSSLHQGYPSLAGQPAVYLADQLRSFAGGQRNNPMMGPLAMTLSADDIGALSKYFAAQPAVANQFFRGDAALAQRGSQIVAKGNCTACHGPDLAGANQFPRLAGQSYDYLVQQLDTYADGTRRDPSNTMNALASAWSPEDRQGIATFLASHPVTGNAKL